MADTYDTTCSSSPELDDISLFLHQFLLRSSPPPSSSSSAAALMVHNAKHLNNYFSHTHLPQFQNSSDPLAPDPILTAQASSAAVFSSSGDHLTASIANVYSSSGGIGDTDADEYDCESEEGFEGKPMTTRNPSKRSRAAEVHNLSEKRRRSRINEKMKALQNLIPNSNKTDKASMLDEAIDYLKQLQLQVQMLTMRNGLSLSPLCLSGVLQPTQLSQMRMGLCEGNESLNMNLTGALAMNQETPKNTVFSLPNQCCNPHPQSVANLSNIVNSGTLYGLQSSIHAHFRPFPPHKLSEENCRIDLLHRQQLNVDHREFNMGGKSTMSVPFDTQASGSKDNTLESCIRGRDRAEAAILNNLDCNSVLSLPLNGLDSRRRPPNHDIKTRMKD